MVINELNKYVNSRTTREASKRGAGHLFGSGFYYLKGDPNHLWLIEASQKYISKMYLTFKRIYLVINKIHHAMFHPNTFKAGKIGIFLYWIS